MSRAQAAGLALSAAAFGAAVGAAIYFVLERLTRE